MKMIVLSLFLILYLAPSTSFAQEKPSIACITLDTQGVPATVGPILAERVTEVLVKSGFFSVVERGRLDAILREQGLQQVGCTDTECAVKIGRVLNIGHLVLGTASSIGRRFMVSLRVVNIESGKIEHAVSKDRVGKIEDVVDLAREATLSLIERMGLVREPEKPPDEVPRPPERVKPPTLPRPPIPYYAPQKSALFAGFLSFIFPGGGSFYNGHPGRGLSHLLLRVGTIPLGILLFELDEYDYYDKEYTEYYDYNGDGYTDKIKVEEWVEEEKWGGALAGFTVFMNSFSLLINDIIDSAATTSTDNFYRLPKELKTWYNAPRKSRFAAGILSFISPGGGHYYNGKPIKGFLYNAMTTACFAISLYCFGGEYYDVHRDKTIYVWDEYRGYYKYYDYICEGSQSTYEENNPTLGWVLFFGGCALRIVDIIHAVIDAGKYNERLMQGLLPERRGELSMTLTMQYRPREKDLLLGLGIRF